MMADDRAERVHLLLDWASLRLQRDRVPNVYDNAVFSIAEALIKGTIVEENVDAALSLLEDLVAADRDASAEARFVPLLKRLHEIGGARTLPPLGYILGQGVNTTPRWRGELFYKSVWDMALYQELLWDIRPGVIVELGSGDGASADWFATMSEAFELRAEVVSFDAEPPTTGSTRAATTFIEARFPQEIDRVVAWCETLDRSRPWLVVEDMHVGIDIVLPTIVGLMRSGDYLVVEDSAHKQGVLRQLANGPVALDVDQAYTDKFGVNGTSAMNSVLRVRR